jgi:drug/metabolite transporter (DMT)-like permease
MIRPWPTVSAHPDSPTFLSAYLRLTLGAAMISFAPVFVRVVDVPPTASAFYRVLFGGLMLLGWLVLSRRGRWPARRTLAWLALAGLAFAADLWAWHRSIWYVGPGLATLLANFQVFVLGLAGIWLFGERSGWRFWMAIPMALAGLALVIGFDWASLSLRYRWGIAFGLLTALFYAAYILSLRASRRGGETDSPAAGLAVASLVSALALGILAPAGGESLAIPSLQDGMLLLLYALVAQVLGWILISGSLAQVPASRVGLILLLQPTLALLWDALFFARSFGARELVGASLAIGAIYLGSRRR